MIVKSVVTRTTDYVHQYAAVNPLAEAIVFGSERISHQATVAQVEICARALFVGSFRKPLTRLGHLRRSWNKSS